jgi:hypothetical protein
MSALRTYRVFISHAWEYNYEYYRLEQMLNNTPYFCWHNYSVPEHDALVISKRKELVNALIRQIRPTNVVLIISGMYVNYRRWIQKEIDIALELNKPIVGVVTWGQARIPRDVQDVSDVIAFWNTSSIVSAIRECAL